jgi:hypothetical protein
MPPSVAEGFSPPLRMVAFRCTRWSCSHPLRRRWTSPRGLGKFCTFADLIYLLSPISTKRKRDLLEHKTGMPCLMHYHDFLILYFENQYHEYYEISGFEFEDVFINTSEANLTVKRILYNSVKGLVGFIDNDDTIWKLKE